MDIRFGRVATFELASNDRLSVTAAEGNQAGDLTFVGFDSALSRDINGIARFGRPLLPYCAAPGDMLFDGEGEAVLQVGPVAGGGHNDIMLPGCRKELYSDGRLGCRDLVAAALGIRRSEITGMLSFFAMGTAEACYFDALAGIAAAPGAASCQFMALRSVTVALTACPGTDIPGFVPGALRVEVDGGAP